MASEKYITSLKIRSPDPSTNSDDPLPQSFEQLISALYLYKEPVAVNAIKLLNEIKKGGFKDSMWLAFCEREKIPKEHYHNVLLPKLIAAGIVRKLNDVWQIDSYFSDYLKECARIFDKWRKQVD